MKNGVAEGVTSDPHDTNRYVISSYSNLLAYYYRKIDNGRVNVFFGLRSKGK